MNALPETWEYAKIGQICRLINGRAYKKKELLGSGKYPVLRVGNLFTNPEWYFSDLELDSDKYCDNGDLLYAWSASFGPRIWCGEKVIYHYHIWKVIPHMGAISPYYLYYFLDWDKDKIKAEHGTGSTMVHITKGSMEARDIPIPPYEEQKRIADMVRSLKERNQQSRQKIIEILELVKLYRQSVLTSAFCGELTRNKSYKPFQSVLTELKSLRLTSAKTKLQKEKIEDIYKVKERGSYKLPKTWCWVSLGKVVPNLSYGTSKKSQNQGKFPVLRMGNIQRSEIDWTDLVFSSDSEEIEKYELQKNDVLFNRTNSPELVGKSAIYRGERPAIYAGYLIRIRPYEILNAEYLNYCLASNYGRDFCWKVKTDGVSQSNINAQKLASFEVPLCSPDEQADIVIELKKHISIIDIVENECRSALESIDGLDRSILDKAFTGKLVHQDYSDEPASLLLEKIKLERQEQEKNNQTIKKIRKGSQTGKMSEMIVPILTALKKVDRPITAQELLALAGYPIDASTSQIEQFFLDVRNELRAGKVDIERINNEDVFKPIGNHK